MQKKITSLILYNEASYSWQKYCFARVTQTFSFVLHWIWWRIIVTCQDLCHWQQGGCTELSMPSDPCLAAKRVYTGWSDSFLAPLPPRSGGGSGSQWGQWWSGSKHTTMWGYKCECLHLEGCIWKIYLCIPDTAELQQERGEVRSRHFLWPCYWHQVWGISI